MKNSYKLLIIAALVLVGTLTAFDFALKAEFEKGTYKNVRRNFSKLEYKDFDVIEINAANKISVEIQHSDTFDVSISDWIKGFIKIKQAGSHLIIDCNVNNSHTYFGEKTVIIQCPELKELRTDAVVYVNGKPVITKDISNATVFVTRFKQDSLKLSMNNASYVKLFDNQIKHLSADLGKDQSSQSDLVINKSNLVSSADLNIQNSSRLTLQDLTVDNFNYKISDSAQIRLSGASLKLLKK